jgi:uncharacterized protein YndB with AHSA1/START domain
MTKKPKLGRGSDRPRTEVAVRMDAPTELVFSVMTDAWLLPVWVVGATHIRDVDESWPRPGAMVHHQVGAWPLAISDVTAVVEYDEPHRFVLQGRAYPFGEVYIEFDLEADGSGTTVRMGEAPSYGAARIVDNPLQRWVLAARNRESLMRLKAIVENRRDLSVPRSGIGQDTV